MSYACFHLLQCLDGVQMVLICLDFWSVSSLAAQQRLDWFWCRSIDFILCGMHADTFKYRQIDKYMIYAYHYMSLIPPSCNWDLLDELKAANCQNEVFFSGSWKRSFGFARGSGGECTSASGSYGHPASFAYRRSCNWKSLYFSIILQPVRSITEVSLSESSTCFAGGSNDVLRTYALRILW